MVFFLPPFVIGSSVYRGTLLLKHHFESCIHFLPVLFLQYFHRDKNSICISVGIYLCTFVMNTCRLKPLFSSVYGGVGDTIDITTGNFLLDLTHYGRFLVIFLKNLDIWREI